MQLKLTVVRLLVNTIVSKAYQESIANTVLNLNHPLHTQIYEYQMSVVFGLYASIRAVPRAGKRFFFRGGGRDFKISLRIFGESVFKHASTRN